ncbi:MAG: pilus assembly PilX N-terminal domain-containing protein [Desulfobacterales bacterium]|nr:pilus assembly PilX N-terminal domain-containing protein [Desulfobacterales bacterium]
MKTIFRRIKGNDAGFVLVVGLMFMAILSILGSVAFRTTSTDLNVSANYKISEQSFFTAEAGLEEARGRLRGNSLHPIPDNHPTSTQWTSFIGTTAKAIPRGLQTGNAMHSIYAPIEADPGYTVKIVHQTDSSGNILYWGDSDGNGSNEPNTSTGKNIYLVTGYGASHQSNKTLQAEVTKLQLNIPAALYVGANTIIQGASTYVVGSDQCGTSDLPGIVTTESGGSVTLNGTSGSNIAGSGDQDGNGTADSPNIIYDGARLNIEEMIDSLKASADFKYTVNSAVLSNTDAPGPGDGWGSPVLDTNPLLPSTCSDRNIVYYDTGGTFVKFTGSTKGCGILLVEGDLQAHGGFTWNGIIIATGSIIFSGGGASNVTGAVLAGGSAMGDVIGGSVKIIYCSSVVQAQTENLPLRILSWRKVD